MDPKQSRSARLQRSLEELMKQAPEILGALIVSNDAFLVASVIDEADTLGPIAANLFDLAEKATQRLEKGKVERIMVDASEGLLRRSPPGRTRCSWPSSANKSSWAWCWN